MPWGFMPNGMVPNHSSASSLSVQYCGDPMNASMVPCEAAVKHSNGCRIWPPGKTSIRNRPPLISSTAFASRWAAPRCMSNTAVKAVDIRHWTFGCATTLGAATMLAAVAAAITPPAVAINLRRSVVTLPSSPRHELMVGAFGDVILGPHQRLELGDGGVHHPGHWRLLGFLLDDLRRQLLEIAQHRHRQWEHLDLALELRLESFQRDRVLHVEVRATIDLHGRGGMIEHPPEIDRERLVRLLVEAEFVHGAGLVPARVVVVARGLVQAQLHVVMRPHPFAGVDDAPLEGSIYLAAWSKHRRAARPGDDQAAEVRNAHLEPLVVADRVHLLPEPSGHLRGVPQAGARYEVEGPVRLCPELETVALVIPGRHALWVHAERDGREPFDRGLPVLLVLRGGHERLDGALRSSVEAAEVRHDLAGREDLDPEPPAAHLLDHLRQSLCDPLGHVERRGPGRGHSPLNLRLRDDGGGVDDGCRVDGRHRPARRCDEPASLGHHRP